MCDNILKSFKTQLISGFHKGVNSQIIYLEAAGSYTIIHFERRDITGMISYRLCLIQTIGSKKDVIRCHKSYSVNIHEIEKICLKKRRLIMRNGEKINISRRMLKEVVNTLIRYEEIIQSLD